jgi:hypothetical protein
MKIESLVLELEKCMDIALGGELMAGITKNPIAQKQEGWR